MIRDQFGLGTTSGDFIQAFFAGPRQVDLLILSFLNSNDWLHGDGLPPLALLPTVEIPTVSSSTVFDPNEPACLCPFHARITAVTAGSPAPVPEPGTVILLGSGLFGLLIRRSHKAPDVVVQRTGAKGPSNKLAHELVSQGRKGN